MSSTPERVWLAQVNQLTQIALANEVRHPRLAELKTAIRMAGEAVEEAFKSDDDVVQRAALDVERIACEDLLAFADGLHARSAG